MDLRIENLRVRLQKEEVLHNTSLHIKDGELTAVLGASGCGKSTLLKCIAGLLEIEAGEICFDGEPVNKIPPEDRGAVIVFQDLRLFPHMTVEKNIAFAMDLKRVPKRERRETVHRLLEDVQLQGYENRKIRELSGGQMQRVALARALAAEPKILLLDEPFSGLDEKLRLGMGELVKNLHAEKRLTTILVTHDRQEALRLADRVALMSGGRILQCGGPGDIFWHPVSKEAAEYFGRINYIRGTVADGVFSCALCSCRTERENGIYDMAVRPFDIQLLPGEKTCRVTDVVFMGEMAELMLDTSAGQIVCSLTGRQLEESGITAGSRTGIYVDAKRAVYFKSEDAISMTQG